MLKFEENINKVEITLHGLAMKSELVKNIKFDDGKTRVSFDVVVRVRQAFKKDEMWNKTTT